MWVEKKKKKKMIKLNICSLLTFDCTVAILAQAVVPMTCWNFIAYFISCLAPAEPERKVLRPFYKIQPRSSSPPRDTDASLRRQRFNQEMYAAQLYYAQDFELRRSYEQDYQQRRSLCNCDICSSQRQQSNQSVTVVHVAPDEPRIAG